MRSLLYLLLLCLVTGFSASTLSDKQYLFVGLYRVPQVKGPCNNVEMKQVAASSKKEGNTIKAAFLKEYGTKQEGAKVLGPGDAAIVYEFEKSEGAASCTSKIRVLRSGKSITQLQADMERDYEKRPRHYKTKPAIIFTWDGKKK